jgi:hypothetical protein
LWRSVSTTVFHLGWPTAHLMEKLAVQENVKIVFERVVSINLPFRQTGEDLCEKGTPLTEDDPLPVKENHLNYFLWQAHCIAIWICL